MNIAYNALGKKKPWQYPYSLPCAKDSSGNTFVCALRGQKIEADSLTLHSRGAPEITVGNDEMIFEAGKSLIGFRVEENIEGLLSGYGVLGWDMMAARSFVGSAELTDIPLIGGDAPWLEGLPFDSSRWAEVNPDRPVADLADAKEMAKGTLWKNSMGYMTAEGTIEGNGKLHPGMRVTVKGVGPRFEGEYRCRKVLHTLGRKTGFLTRFVAERNAKDRNTAVELRNAGVSPVAARQAQEQQAANEAEEEAGDTPVFSNLRWEKDGAAVTEALVDDKVSLCFDVENIPDGARVNVGIWEHDDDDEHDHVADEAGTVRNGKVEIEWQVEYVPDEDDGSTSAEELKEKGYTLPEYHFIAEYDGVESGASAVLEVQDWVSGQLFDEDTDELLANRSYTLYFADGTKKTGETDEQGYIQEENIFFGEIQIEMEGDN